MILDETKAPIRTNDNNQAFSVGSRWIDALNKKEYVCLDATANNATWTSTSGPIEHDAVVDINGTGDYTSLSEAFNSGHKSIFIKQGIYYETNNINIPNGGIVVGETPSNVFIVLIGQVSLKVDGSGGLKELQGTVSISTDSKTVVGVNTQFTNIVNNCYILLADTFHFIESISSNTELTLKHAYRGNTLVEQQYVAQNMYSGVVIRNLVITQSSHVGLYLRGVYHFIIDTVTVQGCSLNVEITDCGSCIFGPFASISSNSIGIYMKNSYSCIFTSCEISNSKNDGINFVEKCKNIILNNIGSSGNGGNGINFGGSCSNIDMIDTICSNNAGFGIYSDTLTNTILLGNIIVNNNGNSGINLNGGNNLITNCSIANNVGTGVNIGKCGNITNCSIRMNSAYGVSVRGDNPSNIVGNHVTNNGKSGMDIITSHNTITSNYIYNNDENGIIIEGGEYNIISGNVIHDNSINGINILLSSSNNTISSNKIINSILGVKIGSGSIKSHISDNVITNCTSHGNGNFTTIVGNDSSENGGNGCIISSDILDTFMIANRFYDNTGENLVDNGDIVYLPPILINRLDSRTNSKLNIGDINATEIMVGQSGINIGIKGKLKVDNSLNVVGDITTTGLVKGRDLVVDGINLDNHISNITNPHDVTKVHVGLSNVTNDAQIPISQKGIGDGVATLNINSKINVNQLYKYDSYGFSSNTNSLDYTRMFQFIYPGTNNTYPLTSIQIIGFMEYGGINYSVKIQDYTNRKTITELFGLTNTKQQIIDMTSITNIPTSTSIIEIQAKIHNSSNESCYLSGILCKYN
jgi:parallel beta-helix repeat protein